MTWVRINESKKIYLENTPIPRASSHAVCTAHHCAVHFHRATPDIRFASSNPADNGSHSLRARLSNGGHIFNGSFNPCNSSCYF